MVLPYKIGNAVFGHHIVNMGSSSDHTSPRFERRYNSTHDRAWLQKADAMMALPPSLKEAPLIKSIWPPTPEYILDPMESAHICPVTSTSMAELMATILGFMFNRGDVVHIVRTAQFYKRIVINIIV
jgi:hypothetical protein